MIGALNVNVLLFLLTVLYFFTLKQTILINLYPFDGSSVFIYSYLLSNTFWTTLTARLIQAIFKFQYHLIR